MTFFINLILSVIYCSNIDRSYKTNIFTKYGLISLYLPLIALWCFICGGQYGVGTDYFSYIEIFNGEHLEYYSANGEILFSLFIKVLNQLGFYGQSIYFVIYSISFLCLFGLICKLKLRYSGVFILLFITVTGLFHNQLNIVRQAFTVYLGTVAAYLIFNNKKIFGILLIIAAMLFHISAIIFFVFLIPTRYVRAIKQRVLILILSSSLLFSFISSRIELNSVTSFLPASYAWYIIDDNLGSVSLINSLTKYIYIPLYLITVIYYKKLQLNEMEDVWFKWGIIGFAIKIAVLNIGLINRLSLGFLIVSLFPLYYYMRYLMLHGRYIKFNILALFLILLYSVKVILFPIKEYDYYSIFFNL